MAFSAILIYSAASFAERMADGEAGQPKSPTTGELNCATRSAGATGPADKKSRADLLERVRLRAQEALRRDIADIEKNGARSRVFNPPGVDQKREIERIRERMILSDTRAVIANVPFDPCKGETPTGFATLEQSKGRGAPLGGDLAADRRRREELEKLNEKYGRTILDAGTRDGVKTFKALVEEEEKRQAARLVNRTAADRPSSREQAGSCGPTKLDLATLERLKQQFQRDGLEKHKKEAERLRDASRRELARTNAYLQSLAENPDKAPAEIQAAHKKKLSEALKYIETAGSDPDTNAKSFALYRDVVDQVIQEAAEDDAIAFRRLADDMACELESEARKRGLINAGIGIASLGCVPVAYLTAGFAGAGCFAAASSLYLGSTTYNYLVSDAIVKTTAPGKIVGAEQGPGVFDPHAAEAHQRAVEDRQAALTDGVTTLLPVGAATRVARTLGTEARVGARIQREVPTELRALEKVDDPPSVQRPVAKLVDDDLPRIPASEAPTIGAAPRKIEAAHPEPAPPPRSAEPPPIPDTPVVPSLGGPPIKIVRELPRDGEFIGYGFKGIYEGTTESGTRVFMKVPRYPDGPRRDVEIRQLRGLSEGGHGPRFYGEVDTPRGRALAMDFIPGRHVSNPADIASLPVVNQQTLRDLQGIRGYFQRTNSDVFDFQMRVTPNGRAYAIDPEFIPMRPTASKASVREVDDMIAAIEKRLAADARGVRPMVPQAVAAEQVPAQAIPRRPAVPAATEPQTALTLSPRLEPVRDGNWPKDVAIFDPQSGRWTNAKFDVVDMRSGRASYYFPSATGERSLEVNRHTRVRSPLNPETGGVIGPGDRVVYRRGGRDVEAEIVSFDKQGRPVLKDVATGKIHPAISLDRLSVRPRPEARGAGQFDGFQDIDRRAVRRVFEGTPDEVARRYGANLADQHGLRQQGIDYRIRVAELADGRRVPQYVITPAADGHLANRMAHRNLVRNNSETIIDSSPFPEHAGRYRSGYNNMKSVDGRGVNRVAFDPKVVKDPVELRPVASHEFGHAEVSNKRNIQREVTHYRAAEHYSNKGEFKAEGYTGYQRRDEISMQRRTGRDHEARGQLTQAESTYRRIGEMVRDQRFGVREARRTVSDLLTARQTPKVTEFKGAPRETWDLGNSRTLVRLTERYGNISVPQIGVGYRRPNGDVGQYWLPISRELAQLPPQELLRRIGPVIRQAEAELIRAGRAVESDIQRIERRLRQVATGP